MIELQLHPLINPNSKHYSDEKEETAIEKLEKEMTVPEMIGACKFNIGKYTYRQDKKGQKEADIVKIDTYNNYMIELLKLFAKIPDKNMSVHNAWKFMNIQWRYR